jgi:hypothetical protein
MGEGNGIYFGVEIGTLNWQDHFKERSVWITYSIMSFPDESLARP